MVGGGASREKAQRLADGRARMAIRRRLDAKKVQMATSEARLEEKERELDDVETEMVAEWEEMLERRREELRRRWKEVMRHRVMRVIMRRQAAAAELAPAVPDPEPSMPVIE
jgi:hypothetical protein